MGNADRGAALQAIAAGCATARLGELRRDLADAQEEACIGQLRPLIHEAWADLAGEGEDGKDGGRNEGAAHA